MWTADVFRQQKITGLVFIFALAFTIALTWGGPSNISQRRYIVQQKAGSAPSQNPTSHGIPWVPIGLDDLGKMISSAVMNSFKICPHSFCAELGIGESQGIFKVIVLFSRILSFIVRGLSRSRGHRIVRRAEVGFSEWTLSSHHLDRLSRDRDQTLFHWPICRYWHQWRTLAHRP